eukprot:scaffold11418_cov70-Phaeocystis_antarctica.AAC.2
MRASGSTTMPLSPLTSRTTLPALEHRRALRAVEPPTMATSRKICFPTATTALRDGTLRATAPPTSPNACLSF